MRLLRACLLLGLVAGATALVARAVHVPLLEGWRAVGTTAEEPVTTRAADLTALLTGGCALALALAWLWLAAAVAACTWEALHHGPGRPGSSLVRPHLVRVLVATCLGVTALAGPATAAPPPVMRVRALPDDLRSTVVTPALALRLLDGLPVPDRAAGAVPDHAHRRPPVRTSPPPRLLQVEPGDSLWSLTAGLLPPGAPSDAIAAGWRLLYAANRNVVGADPDLLQPGQTLRLDLALGELVAATHAAPPLDHAAGGPR